MAFSHILAGATGLAIFLTQPVFGAPVVANSDVNVRSGPGTDFAVLDTLSRGEAADTLECRSSGWCRVQFAGPTGWVYSQYLTPTGGGGGGGRPSGSFGNAPPVPSGAAACFYTEQGWGGTAICIQEGTYDTLGGADNSLRSYSVAPGVHVNFCVEPGMRGACYEGNRSTPTLGPPLDRQASSMTIFRPGGSAPVVPGGGAPAQQAPVVPQGSSACFYTQQNWGGDRACLAAGTYATLGGFDDRIRSYAVAPGISVNFCVSENLRGACFTGSRSTPTLGAPLDRQASSFDIYRSVNGQAPQPQPTPQPAVAPDLPVDADVCFFSEQNWGGQSACVTVGTYGNLGYWDNLIRSYVIRPGYSVNFCLEANMRGNCFDGQRTTPTLGAVLDRRASSLSVAPLQGPGQNFALPPADFIVQLQVLEPSLQLREQLPVLDPLIGGGN